MSIIIYVDTVYSESLRGWGMERGGREGERGEGGRERVGEIESNTSFLTSHLPSHWTHLPSLTS